jgi:TetR/AcrR family transcriptional regulator, transcriptional repressor for nem operon
MNFAIVVSFIWVTTGCLRPEYDQGHILGHILDAAFGGQAMPYPRDHADKTRARIVEAARRSFNLHGFDGASIDAIMAEAGLTRGAFYAHFPSKSALYAEAITAFLAGRGREWRDSFGIDPELRDAKMARAMIEGYLSDRHFSDLEAQCPLIALPTDAARAEDEVRLAYQQLLESMVWFFEVNGSGDPKGRERALAQAALCVGGMVLARALPDSGLASEIRAAARRAALREAGMEEAA